VVFLRDYLKEGLSVDLVERVKAIVFMPKDTWQIIKGEEMTIKRIYTSYAAILALIPAVASFIGWSLVGYRAFFVVVRQPVVNGLAYAVLYYVFSLLGVFVTAYVANMLAPRFGGRQDLNRAVKVIAFSYTPAWIAGVLYIIPSLAFLAVVLSLYSLYLLYLGLPALMETLPEKSIVYVAAIVVVSIVVMVVISMIANVFLASSRVTTGFF
jgi:hypothetical protein